MFSFAKIAYVSLLCAAQHLLVLTKLNSNNAEFLEHINSKYVTWFLFTTQNRLNSMVATTMDCLQQNS